MGVLLALVSLTTLAQEQKKYYIELVPAKMARAVIAIASANVQTDEADSLFVMLPEGMQALFPDDVQLANDDFIVKGIQLQVTQQRILIELQENLREWNGKIMTKVQGVPVVQATITLPDIPTATAGTTNTEGEFKLFTPRQASIQKNSHIQVNGVRILPENIKVLASTHLIIIRVPQRALKNNVVALDTRELYVKNRNNEPIANIRVEIDSIPYFTDSVGIAVAKLPINRDYTVQVAHHTVINTQQRSETAMVEVVVEPLPYLQDSESLPSDTDPFVLEIDSEIGEIIAELDAQTKFIDQQNINIRRQIDLLSERLAQEESDMTPQQRSLLQQLLYHLQRKLYENEKRFNELQQESQEIISQMQETLKQKDSTNYQLTEENKLQEMRNKRLQKENEEFRTRVLFLSSGSVLLLALALIFYLVARRDRAQKARISQQAQKLQSLNQRILKQKKEITDSLRYAQTIQMAILPNLNRFQQMFPNHFILYKPRNIVSGDFYWAYEIEPNAKWLVAVVDCTGHGVPGAFMSMIGSTLLTRIVEQRQIYQTNQLLDTLNQEIVRVLRQEDKANDDGMDVCLCLFEKNEVGYHITFTGAKRPLLYIRTEEGNVAMLRGDVKTIGGLRHKDKEFTQKKIQLSKGDFVLLSSDGLVDQHDAAQKKFGTKKLIQILEQHHHLTMSQLSEKIEEQFQQHQQSMRQRDDITLLGIKL